MPRAGAPRPATPIAPQGALAGEAENGFMPRFEFWPALRRLIAGSRTRNPRCSAAFVICTERHFENKSLLLVKTLRRFGGTLGQMSPVYSYSPRPAKLPSERVQRQLADLDVRLVLDVNSRWPEYDFANKVAACAHAERTLSAETIIFLDSDKIVLRQPSALTLPPDVDIAARPVDGKFIGCSGDQRDENYGYWCRLYEIANAVPKRTVRTTFDNQVIWEYYNSGLVAAKRAAGIFSHWETVFDQVLASGLLPTTGLHYVEQSALAASIAAKARHVQILTNDYNLPLIPEYATVLANQPQLLSNAITVHYHSYFDNGQWEGWLSREREWGLAAGQRSWLMETLAKLAI